MQHIQSVIRETIIPSWIRSVPKSFGEARAGTLKADEWCTLATIYLPLALVSVWGEGSAHQSHEVKVRLRAVLDNTMALVSAIRIACSRTMTHSRIRAYRSCILTWCHDRDNSRLAPSENARKANTGRREWTRASTVPPTEPQRASEQREHARYLSHFR